MKEKIVGMLVCTLMILTAVPATSSLNTTTVSKMRLNNSQPCSPPDWSQLQKLLASDGATWDVFGCSVSLSGDTALIGAYQDNDKGTNSGSAYVFTYTAGTWTQQQKLNASDGAAGDGFGFSVSVDGDTALIGAWFDDDEGTNSGSAYIFTRTGITWTQQAKLLASDGAPYDYFGYSVSLSGDTALIGAEGDDGYKGSVYVFTRTITTWTQQQKLLATDNPTDRRFGYSVSLSGDTALIGATSDDNWKGSAYVFTRTGTTWTQQQKLNASDGVANDRFGGSVSLFGDTALIGAYNDDDNGADSGSAYVFTRTAGTWTPQQKLTASDGAAGDYFGGSVSISGDTALIGAYFDDDNGDYSGSAYVFTRTGTTWTQQQKLLASDGAEQDWFGYSVSLDGDTALIGAYGDDSYKGTAYVFIKGDENQPPVFGTPTPANGSTNNPLSLTWSIPINDPDGDLFSWTIQCSNGQSISGAGATNGTESLVLSGLVYSTTYKVWVNATDPDGSGLFTRMWYDFTTMAELNNPPYVPSSPDPVDGASGVDVNAVLSWTGGDPDAGDTVTYDVYFGTVDPPGIVVHNQSATLYDPVMVYLTTYYWKVVAWDDHGASAEGSVWHFMTKMNNPPVFGTPNPSNGSSGNPLSLTWSIPISDPEGNLFSWTIQCSNGQTNSGSGASNGTKTLSLSGLSYSTTYTVWVNATDPTGSGLYTRKWYTFTTKASQPPVFGTPTPSNGSSGNPLSLTWSIPISDPEGDSFDWTIQCSNGQNAGVDGASNGTESLALSGLAYSTTYKVWVNATDPGGSGLYTRKWYTFTTKINQPPAFGSPTPSNDSTNNLLSFTWSLPINDPEGDLFSWTIQCNNGQTNGGTSAHNGTKALALSGLEYSTTYKVWVNATDPDGSGLSTRHWYTFTTKTEPPNPPTVTIIKPYNGLYVKDKKLLSLKNKTFVYGPVTVVARVNGTNISTVRFLVDGTENGSTSNVGNGTVSFPWAPKTDFHGLSIKHNLTIVAMNITGSNASASVIVTKWRSHALPFLLLLGIVMVSSLVPKTTINGLVFNVHTSLFGSTFFAINVHYRSTGLMKSHSGNIILRSVHVGPALMKHIVKFPMMKLAYISGTFLGAVR